VTIAGKEHSLAYLLIPIITGIKLINSSPQRQCVIAKDVKLSLRSLVNPALIPLYARAGPSVEVHSTDVETSQWLKTRLLSSIWLEEEDDDDIDGCKSMQCPVGLLLNVEGTGGHPSGCVVSELLIYGILSTPDTLGRPLSPPHSSSLGDIQQDEHTAIKRELRIYAAPLSSSFVQKAHNLPSPPSSPSPVENIPGREPAFAQFIPDLRSPSPKRKRIATMFEVAAQHHRRVRQRGGEAVSQLMANTASQFSTPHLPPFSVKKEPEEASNPALERLGSRRSRSLSVSGNLRVGKDTHAEDARSGIVKGHIRRAASTRELSHSFAEAESQSAVASPTLPVFHGDKESAAMSKDAQTIISENKALITRTILTCMRLYGFHRKAPRTSSMSKNNVTTNSYQDVDPLNEESIVAEALTVSTEHGDAPGPGPGHGHGPSAVSSSSFSSASDEEEFKAMYHATYKASIFALRKYLKDVDRRILPSSNDKIPPVLSKEKVTNVVDGFLKLFCEDN
jgi:hypothetical protein